MTALMAAAHGGHVDVIQMLLERGADAGLRDDHQVSALDYALREDHAPVVKAIIAHANAAGPGKFEALQPPCNMYRTVHTLAHRLRRSCTSRT